MVMNIIKSPCKKYILLSQTDMKKATRRAMDESLAKSKSGDLVYYGNHHRRGKLDVRWRSYYVVVEKTGPVT